MVFKVKSIKLIALSMIFMFYFFYLCLINVYAIDEKEEKLEVLFISSFNINFISFDDQLKGIQHGLDNANVMVEYMDLKDGKNEESFYNLLKYTFETYENIDVIIAGDDDATEFCMKYRDDLFKDIPISFLGVQEPEIRDKALTYDNVSGVSEEESIKENIELIKRFHPNVDTITFIDTLGNRLYEEITKEYPEFEFNWIITKDRSVEETQKLLSDLDENDAIIQLYVANFKDNNFIDREYIENIIYNNCKEIPIYNILSYDLGYGSIGGKVINHFNQGKKAGEVATKLLNGENARDIYVGDDSANEFIFDYDALKKFNIKVKDLPKGSTIINHPQEILIKYKGIVIWYIILTIWLISIVVILLFYIKHKNRYEKAILKAKNNAEEAKNIKSHFISNISHELKTPINVIISATQLFKVKNNSKELSYEDISTLNIIDDNCNRLLRLLNNVIDAQKSELNELDLKLVEVNIVELVESLLESIVPYSKVKDLNLIFDTDEEEIIMTVDVDKIERVILNLLSNAIKFSKQKGSINVSIKFEEDLYIIVEDEGIGIDEKYINDIFNKFTQLDTTLCRQNEGSGIGLSIVKSFVELHGGKIFVESQKYEGTKFTILLPIITTKEKYKELLIEDDFKDNIKMELSDIYI